MKSVSAKKHKKRDPRVVSYTMSRIRSKDTSIEMRLRQALWKAGYRYRKNYPNAPGKPDIAFPGIKIAIFADSSFWHGFDWEVKKKRLHTHRKYWIKKIERNMERDKDVTRQLQDLGWIVLRFWDFEIEKELDKCVATIVFHITQRKK